MYKSDVEQSTAITTSRKTIIELISYGCFKRVRWVP